MGGNSVQIQRHVKFLRACFQADNREQSLWNMFGSTHEHRDIADVQALRDLLVQGHLTLPEAEASALQKRLQVYRREKQLLLGQLLVLARLPVGRQGRELVTCAPLLIYEGELKTSESVRLVIKPGSRRWNMPLLRVISADPDLADNLGRCLDGNGMLDLDQAMQVLGECLPEKWSVTRHLEAQSEKNLQALMKHCPSHEVILSPGFSRVLVKRGLGSRGPLDELAQLAKASQFSNPLQQLLGNSKPNASSGLADMFHIPGVLSEAQQQAVQNAAKHNLSVVIGPPGTGKSHTIACTILERYLQGESVLVVTRNDDALAVINEILAQQLGIDADAIIRGGHEGNQGRLKDRLNTWLNGQRPRTCQSNQSRLLWRLTKRIKRNQKAFMQLAQAAESDGQFLHEWEQQQVSHHWVNRLKLWWILRRHRNAELLGESLDRINGLQTRRETMLAEHISLRHDLALRELLDNDRDELVKFHAALKARTSLKQIQRFAKVDAKRLFNALPIWLCSLSNLHRSLPLTPGLFDLVIIDEATQCDMASCLPAVQRARRVMVVGDPKQLRHVSFLSVEKQQELAQKHQIDADLDHRQHSMIDLALNRIAHQSAAVFLNEHYRSHPSIIAYSNQYFYADQLRVMTEQPGWADENRVRIIRTPEGQRVKGINQVELDVIMAHVAMIINKQADWPDGMVDSIGLLSFFREQAEALQQALMQRFELSVLVRHRIRAATPYGFQGDERDLMLISCALDSNSSGAAFRYMNRDDVFNVAITRAKNHLVLVTSLGNEQIPLRHHLRNFLMPGAFFSGHEMNPVKAGAIAGIRSALSALKVDIETNVSLAGMSMDLVIFSDDVHLVLDLIGFPGAFNQGIRLSWYQVFERAGLAIFPVSYVNWTQRPGAVIQAIEERLAKARKTAMSEQIHQTQLWKKLAPINTEATEAVKALEIRMLSDEGLAWLELLEQLVSAYVELDWMLKQNLEVIELTYLRYHRAATVALLSGIEHIQGCLGQSLSTDRTQPVEAVLDEFKSTTMSWRESMVSTACDGNSVEEALTGLRDLNRRDAD